MAVGDGQTSVPDDKGGSGVKKGLVGTAVGLTLLGGGLLLANTLGDRGDSGDSGGDAAIVDDGGGGNAGDCGSFGDSGNAGDTDLAGLQQALSGDCTFASGANVFDCAAPLNCEPPTDLLVQGFGVEIFHGGDGLPTDAVNGGQGPSGAAVVGQTTWDDLIQIAADCGGQITTGQGEADADGFFRVAFPLYQFGPCEIVEFKLRTGTTFSDGLPVDALDIGTTFDVTEDPVTVDDADFAAFRQYFAEIDAGIQDAQVVADLLNHTDFCFADTLLSDAAVRQAFAALCQPSNGWFYGLQAVDSADDGDPLLVGGTTLDGFDQASLDLLFGTDGIYRCGAGQVGFTVCPDASGSFAPGPLSIYQAVFPGGVAQDATFTLPGIGDVTVEPDGTDSTMTVDGDVAARAIVRDGAVTLVIPGAGPDGFRVGPNIAVVPDPTVTLEGTDDGETVEDFAGALAAAFRSGDSGFLLGRLNAVVLQAFPDECPAHFDALPPDPSYAITPIDVSPSAQYDYAPPSLGGPSFPVDAVVTVTADVTAAGETSRQELHFGSADGQYSWFADCGT